MKRILVIAGVLVALVVIGIVVFLLTGLGAAIKAVVEGVGSKATGTHVTLHSADVSLTSGEGTLKGLVVGNPEGFKTASAIELGQIHVKIDTSTVTSNPIVIKEILIEGPKVTYELSGSGSNIGVIQDNVAKMGGGTDEKKPAPEPKEKEPKEPKKGGETKVVIEDLVVRDGHVAVSATFLGGKELGAPLPEVHLKDIGKDEGGASSSEVAEKILGAITKGATDAVGTLNLAGLEKAAGGAVDSVLQGAKDIFGGKKKDK
jgi:hypothetical protein